METLKHILYKRNGEIFMKLKKLLPCVMTSVVAVGFFINGNLTEHDVNAVSAKKTENLSKVIELPIIPIGTTTTVTTTSKTTTTTVTTVVTTQAPTAETIDFSQVKYGDINLDGDITTADVIAINKYLVNKNTYALKNAVAMENADCVKDGNITQEDTLAIINYCLQKITESDLGKVK
jgi:hypothetical protein